MLPFSLSTLLWLATTPLLTKLHVANRIHIWVASGRVCSWISIKITFQTTIHVYTPIDVNFYYRTEVDCDVTRLLRKLSNRPMAYHADTEIPTCTIWMWFQYFCGSLISNKLQTNSRMANELQSYNERCLWWCIRA